MVESERKVPDANGETATSARIIINDVEYDGNKLTEETKVILGSLQFTEARLRNLQNELAVCQTARQSYLAGLMAELQLEKTDD